MQVVYKWGTILTLVLIPIWPLLTLPAGVFPEVKGPQYHASQDNTAAKCFQQAL